MSLSNPRVLFGIHSVAPYNRADGTFYGIAKVIGTLELNLSGKLVDLYGGSSQYPWSVQSGVISTDIKLGIKEFPDFLFQLFLGHATTDNAAEASASVTSLTNVKGTSVMNGTTGVASVAVKSGSETDVKFGYFVVKAVSATTVDVYLASDADIARGNAGSYQNDLLKITASPLTITTGATHTTIPNFGVDLVGGSGAIGMTSGDTATFKSRPINTASRDVTVGVAGDVNAEFGMVVIGEKEGDGKMVEIDLYRVKGIGMPFPMKEKAFVESQIAMKAFYDSAKNGVFSIRDVSPTTFT